MQEILCSCFVKRSHGLKDGEDHGDQPQHYHGNGVGHINGKTCKPAGLVKDYPCGKGQKIAQISDEIEKRALRLEKEPGQQGVDKQNAHHDGADQNDGVGQYEIQY
jgi:hypothetical protein